MTENDKIKAIIADMESFKEDYAAACQLKQISGDKTASQIYKHQAIAFITAISVCKKYLGK